MRLLKILALSGAATILCVFLAACGGGGSKPPAPPSAPTITSSQLTPGAVNVQYSGFLTASGGTAPYTWTISSGSLPPGLTLTASEGAISGTPTTFGTYSFTAKVTDSNSLSASGNVTISIEGAIVINCVSCSPGSSTLPSGAVGVAYSATLSASGGKAPYTWCVVETTGACDNGAGTPSAGLTQSGTGSLPAGLTLNASTGVISGTPTTAGPPSTFTVRATDSETTPSSGSAAFTLTVMEIQTTSLPNATINTPYSEPVTAVGGQANYTWSVVSGSLPAGLSVANSTCVNAKTATCSITGTPTVVGVSSFTLQVADGETPPATATAALTIDVQGPLLKITTTSLPSGTVGLPYSAPLQATGGIPPLSWSIATGTLPAGLSLSASTGVISGTPTASGISAFVPEVQDSESPPQKGLSAGPLNITISPAITDASLKGNYAFTLNGYQNGTPVLMAGAFTADGSGNLTQGALDLNDGSGEAIDGQGNVVPQTLTTGSVYSLTPSGQGSMTLVTSQGTYKFAIVVSGNACLASGQYSTCGRLIQSDPSDPQAYGSGVIKVQDSQQFVLSPGSFAVHLSGTDPQADRYAGAGAFEIKSATLGATLDCSTWGLPSGCPGDVNDAGTASSITILGTFDSIIDQNTGRGAFVDLTFNGDAGNVFTYAYYIVNQNEMVLISADPISKPANLTLWSAFRQNASATGWGLASLQGASVIELNAVNPNGGTPLANVTAGLFTGDGKGNATFTSDQNDGGTLSLQQSSPGTYAIDSSGQKTGRVTLSGFSAQFGTTLPVLYLYGSNSAYVVGTDAEVTSGTLEPQSGSPYSSASISGNYAGGSVWPVVAAVTNSVTSLFANGIGSMSVTQFVSGPQGPEGPNNLTLTYNNVGSTTGRSVVMQGANQYGVMYVVSPDKVVLLPAGNNPALNVYSSGPTN